VFNPSRRAFGIASALTISAVFLAPSASAALLGGSGSTSGSELPLTNVLGSSDGLLSPVTGLLGGGGGGLLAPVTGLLGGSGGGLGGLLGGGGLPVVGGLLGDGGLPLGGLSSADSADSSGGELLSPLTDTTLACDAAIPQVLRSLVLGDLTDTICEPFDGGVLGVLSSL
jgi:hypothetical protein